MAVTVPSFRNTINDAELSAILSYIRNAWGNKSGTLIKDTEIRIVRSGISK